MWSVKVDFPMIQAVLTGTGTEDRGMGTRVVDLTNNHLYWTPQMYKMFGKPKEEGIDLPWVLVVDRVIEPSAKLS